MVGFLQYVKANLNSGKLLVINSDEWNTNDYLNVVDGQFLEGYEHASWISVTTVETDRPSVSSLVKKCSSGKIVWVCPGATVTGATQAQIDAMVKYCYASFLMGMSGSKAYFQWQQRNYPSWYSIMDTDVGQPVGTYTQSGNVLTREFTNCTVTIDLNAHTGEITMK